MSKELSRRQFLQAVTLGSIAVATSVFTAYAAEPGSGPAESPLPTPTPETEELFVPFMVGDINYGTEGKGNGPLTRLTIDLPGEIRNIPQFIMDTYPRLLNAEDTNPGGNYQENDNPTYWNDGQVVVQTIHSGNVWGKDLPANPLRAELQEKNSFLRWDNVTSAEGTKRRARFENAPITLEQEGNIETGKVLSIAHMNPLQTIEVQKAYESAQGNPVDLIQYTDYQGPALDKHTDVIYLYCTEAYFDEVQRKDIEWYEQGRDLLIVRIDK